MSTLRAVQGTVSGRVQGVAFRASFQHEARSLGLAGWVRNQPDGAVAFLIQGAADDVQAMLTWAGRGPRLARVDAVEVEDVPVEETRQGFQIRT